MSPKTDGPGVRTGLGRLPKKLQLRCGRWRWRTLGGVELKESDVTKAVF